MAKGKHAAALFEVITRSRPLNRQNRPGFLHWIAGWFRPARGPDAGSAAAGPPLEETGGVEAAPPALAGDGGEAPGGHEPAHIPGTGVERRMLLDPGRREIAVRMSYVSVGVAALALLTALAGAFLIGQKMGGSRGAGGGKTVAELGGEAPNPEVVNIHEGGQEGGAARVPGRNGGPPPPATQPVRNRERVKGLNYIIVQSYPDETTANAAAKVLGENGVECTAERLPDWTRDPTWWTVVGIDGFKTIHGNRELDSQLSKVKAISDKFARRNTFKAFDPKVYKWKGRAVASGR